MILSHNKCCVNKVFCSVLTFSCSYCCLWSPRHVCSSGCVPLASVCERSLLDAASPLEKHNNLPESETKKQGFHFKVLFVVRLLSFLLDPQSHLSAGQSWRFTAEARRPAAAECFSEDVHRHAAIWRNSPKTQQTVRPSVRYLHLQLILTGCDRSRQTQKHSLTRVEDECL